MISLNWVTSQLKGIPQLFHELAINVHTQSELNVRVTVMSFPERCLCPSKINNKIYFTQKTLCSKTSITCLNKKTKIILDRRVGQLLLHVLHMYMKKLRLKKLF